MATIDIDHLTHQQREFVRRVAALVVARLRALDTEPKNLSICDSPVIDAQRIESFPSPGRLSIATGALVTPLARDRAKDLSIEITRCSNLHMERPRR